MVALRGRDSSATAVICPGARTAVGRARPVQTHARRLRWGRVSLAVRCAVTWQQGQRGWGRSGPRAGLPAHPPPWGTTGVRPEPAGNTCLASFCPAFPRGPSASGAARVPLEGFGEISLVLFRCQQWGRTPAGLGARASPPASVEQVPPCGHPRSPARFAGPPARFAGPGPLCWASRPGAAGREKAPRKVATPSALAGPPPRPGCLPWSLDLLARQGCRLPPRNHPGPARRERVVLGL